MKFSIAVKALCAALLDSSGLVARKLRGNTRYNSVLLMYHRILPRADAGAGVQPGMYVEPGTFETHVRFLKKHFEVIPLSKHLSRAESDAAGYAGRPLCALTFDDGWADFFTYAFPILRAYQVPAAVFLPTGFIGTARQFWTDRLLQLAAQRPGPVSPARSGRPAAAQVINCLKGPGGAGVEKAIALLKACRDEEIEKVITELAEGWGLSPKSNARAFLSWEEIAEMARSGLVSFGSHTVNHRILTTLSDDEIRDELEQSKELLIARGAAGHSDIPFSYPNGNYTGHIARMVREAGYSLAVTTESGWVCRAADPFALRRVAIHQDVTATEALFGCRVAGIV